jgi:hypothetical protein
MVYNLMIFIHIHYGKFAMIKLTKYLSPHSYFSECVYVHVVGTFNIYSFSKFKV